MLAAAEEMAYTRGSIPGVLYQVFKTCTCLQEVAIKMLFQTDQKAQESFLREISMLKFASRDRNVVQFYGVSIQNNGIWLITEHMEVRSSQLRPPRCLYSNSPPGELSRIFIRGRLGAREAC